MRHGLRWRRAMRWGPVEFAGVAGGVCERQHLAGALETLVHLNPPTPFKYAVISVEL